MPASHVVWWAATTTGHKVAPAAILVETTTDAPASSWTGRSAVRPSTARLEAASLIWILKTRPTLLDIDGMTRDVVRIASKCSLVTGYVGEINESTALYDFPSAITAVKLASIWRGGL